MSTRALLTTLLVIGVSGERLHRSCQRSVTLEVFVSSNLKPDVVCGIFVPGMNAFARANPCVNVSVITFLADKSRVNSVAQLPATMAGIPVKVLHAQPDCDPAFAFELRQPPGKSYQMMFYAYADLFTSADIIAMMDDDAILRLPLLPSLFLSDDMKKLRVVRSTRSPVMHVLRMMYGSFNGSGMASFPFFVWRDDLKKFRAHHTRASGFSVLDSYMLVSTKKFGPCFFSGFLNYAQTEGQERYYIVGDEAPRLADHAKYTKITPQTLLIKGISITLACSYGGVFAFRNGVVSAFTCSRHSELLQRHLGNNSTINDFNEWLCKGCTATSTNCSNTSTISAFCTSSDSRDVSPMCSCSTLPGSTLLRDVQWGTVIGPYVFIGATLFPVSNVSFSFWEIFNREEMESLRPGWQRAAHDEWEAAKGKWGDLRPLLPQYLPEYMSRTGFKYHFHQCWGMIANRGPRVVYPTIYIPHFCPTVPRLTESFRLMRLWREGIRRQAEWYTRVITPRINHERWATLSEQYNKSKMTKELFDTNFDEHGFPREGVAQMVLEEEPSATPKRRRRKK